jgi:hypothetical protein
MVGNRYWMPPPRHFQPMFIEFEEKVANKDQTAIIQEFT